MCPAPKISLTVRTLNVFSRYDVPMKPVQVARHLNCPCNVVRVILGRLCDRGDLVRDPSGLYARPAEEVVTIWQITASWASKTG